MVESSHVSANPLAGSAAEPGAVGPSVAMPNAVARLVGLEPGLYAFSISDRSPWLGARAGFAMPAVHISSLPTQQDRAIEITDATGSTGAWLGGPESTLFVRTPPGGGGALITAFLARDAAAPPLDLMIHRLDAAPGSSGTAVADSLVLTVSLSQPVAAEGPLEVDAEIVLHIRGRGDVHFFDPEWAGRLGSGSWIEAFTILPRNALAASAIEYKGLSASGVETPWLATGSPCGTSGRNVPLIGFAVRQKAGVSDVRFDCEYSGYFQSGTTSTPARNGAPCRSATANDPLEGIQLKIVERARRQLDSTAPKQAGQPRISR
jgi:hypothetical protein